MTHPHPGERDNEPAYTPRSEYLCSKSDTHYQGCQCHEGRRNAELESARARIVELEALIARCEEALTKIQSTGCRLVYPCEKELKCVACIAREALAEVRKGRK